MKCDFIILIYISKLFLPLFLPFYTVMCKVQQYLLSFILAHAMWWKCSLFQSRKLNFVVVSMYISHIMSHIDNIFICVSHICFSVNSLYLLQVRMNNKRQVTKRVNWSRFTKAQMKAKLVWCKNHKCLQFYSSRWGNKSSGEKWGWRGWQAWYHGRSSVSTK